jgi:hypothetical protein
MGSLQRLQQAGFDLRGRERGVDGLEPTELAVILDQRRCFFTVHLESLGDDFGAVIIPMEEW